MTLLFTFAKSWPVITAISLIIAAVLYVKGKDRKDSNERYVNDIKGLAARVRNCPVNPESYKTFRDEFRELSKHKYYRRNYESLSVAWSEFKCRFKEYFV
ncbi:hypothetical protein D4R86_04190 [bacterium]|nr:MAG: hypothetical protein D4R86_04190 [bacterium]